MRVCSCNAQSNEENKNAQVTFHGRTDCWNFTGVRIRGEAQILIEQWRIHYNTVRLHSSLDYRPPASKSNVPIDKRPTMH
ncbi:integrase core domain-containing protein [Celeribacter sp.]|uniref:integrase core domain-containing protein n=1 Tax=Celeribacter sp. TaxID=1890673 RepID=UPI003A8DA142